MSISRQEEIISALWVICSLLAFGLHFDLAGWLFGVKAGLDIVFSLCFAAKEARKKKAVVN